uniref:Uncharacterized protein n=1 Tax=Heterorhabditis bacteriophora TaxID=37862 RepID=A0A1I7X3E7_HETBA
MSRRCLENPDFLFIFQVDYRRSGCPWGNWISPANRELAISGQPASESATRSASESPHSDRSGSPKRMAENISIGRKIICQWFPSSLLITYESESS